jgi:hypothetical protein
MRQKENSHGKANISFMRVEGGFVFVTATQTEGYRQQRLGKALCTQTLEVGC